MQNFYITLHPVYSERVSLYQSLIYIEINYVYSEYSVIMNCFYAPFTITGVKFTIFLSKILFKLQFKFPSIEYSPSIGRHE
jgi:hypothetical protein